MSLALAAKNGLSSMCSLALERDHDLADLRQVGDEARAVLQLQPLAGNRGRRDRRRGEPCRRPAAAARIAKAVLVQVGVVGVARAEGVEQVRVVLAALVGVADQEADRRARGPAFEHAREDLDLVRFLTLGDMARGAGAAAVELGLDVGLRELHPGRAAVDDAADRGAVALAEIRDAEQRAEGASRHQVNSASATRAARRGSRPASRGCRP